MSLSNPISYAIYSSADDFAARRDGAKPIIIGERPATTQANSYQRSIGNKAYPSTLPKVLIYTDGACSGNPGPGGWGALLQFEKIDKEIFGHELDTTNNRMEMIAAIQALKALKKPCRVELYTDSKYLQLGITEWINKWLKNNWYKSNNEPVKNVDLWKELYTELSKHSIIWHWVKGHSNNPGNVAADRLAVEAKKTAIKILKCHL